MNDGDVEQDGLEDLRAEVMADPLARAAYEDAQRRTTMLAVMHRARRKQGLSQGHVAKAMRTTQSAVSEIEAGVVDPQLRTLQRYARAIKRRLDIAMVDDTLPVYEEGMANELWRLVEQKALSPLLTGLITQTEAHGRTLEVLAEEFAHLPPEIVRPILTSLQENGWVTTSHHGEEQLYMLKADAAYVIGVSLNRDAVVGVVLDLRSQVIDRRKVALQTSTQAAVIATTVDVVAHLYRDRKVLGVGVSLAGVVNPSTGAVAFAPDLQSDDDAWTAIPLGAHLQNAIQERVQNENLLVSVENDANALAVREYLRCGEHCVATVLLSSSGAGIGAGFVVEGHVIYGEGNSAGEGGHVIVDPLGEKCRGADHFGCLETVATARAILDHLGIPAETPRQVTEGLAAANDRVRRQDKAAIDTFREAGETLGKFLATTMILLDPTRVAIYGHAELCAGEDYPSASLFREGVTTGLQGGVSKAESFRSRLQWHRLDDETDAEAAGAAAMRHIVYRPDRSQQAALVSQTLGVREDGG